MEFLGYIIVAIVCLVAGYAFRGLERKVIGTVGTVGATAKLDAVKVKTAAVKDAVDAHNTVVADLHTAIEDLDKKL
jgi:hypothetical protein